MFYLGSLSPSGPWRNNPRLNFHVVRATRSVQYTPPYFVPERESRTPREAGHLARVPLYPDPRFYLSHTGKYFFRHESLRHLRIEQFNRYFSHMGDGATAFSGRTLEDTVADPDEVPIETSHRHFDQTAQDTEPGSRLASIVHGVDGACSRIKDFILLCLL